MSRDHYKLWAHVIWTTKYRDPVLSGNNRVNIYKHIRKRIENEKAWIDIMNGAADYIHALICYHPKNSISRLMNIMKGESCHQMTPNISNPHVNGWVGNGD
jgi:putative transposase